MRLVFVETSNGVAPCLVGMTQEPGPDRQTRNCSVHMYWKNSCGLPTLDCNLYSQAFSHNSLLQSTQSRSRSHVLHGPSINPEIQHLAPNRTVTESHLLGVCSPTDAEQNGVLLGLPPAATNLDVSHKFQVSNTSRRGRVLFSSWARDRIFPRI